MKMHKARAVFKSLETDYCYQIQGLKIQRIKVQPCSQLHEPHARCAWSESTAFFCRLVYLFIAALTIPLIKDFCSIFH